MTKHSLKLFINAEFVKSLLPKYGFFSQPFDKIELSCIQKLFFQFKVTEDCNCEFVWCCEVKCSKCTKEVIIHTCKWNIQYCKMWIPTFESKIPDVHDTANNIPQPWFQPESTRLLSHSFYETFIQRSIEAPWSKLDITKTAL